MANISLRSYQQEIERLIDSGRTEEAIVHCHHILQTFPKSVDTYRLLGKAFLESQRYGDAADIFQRVLSSIPDDFVSHVGMSIIREDEGNLDEAIWHMERAFEAQPSNGAIQEELRRLFERRDDFEPPKIRLTRGALARMYAKGELNDQAIVEARAVLAKDANRLDIQVLLASVLAQSGNQAEAAEAATNVLQKLPYCLEANRVMAEVLAGSEHLDEAKPYQQRVNSLDPYAAFINEDNPTSGDVPEQVIAIEKVVFKPGDISAIDADQPSWATSLGVHINELGKVGDDMPEWLAEKGDEETEERPIAVLPSGETPASEEGVKEGSTDIGASEDEIPDWMKEAGWGPSSDVGEQFETEFGIDEGFEPEGEIKLEKADIPPWLRAMAPDDGEGTEAIDGIDDDSELPEWLSGSAGEQVEIPDWLSGLESDTQASIPDHPGEPEESDAEEQMPDWLVEGVEELSTQPEEKPGAEEEEELPEWLQEIAPETVSTQEETPSDIEIPDWLMEVEGAEKSVEPDEEEAAPAEEAPGWLAAGAIAASAAAAAKILGGQEEETSEPAASEAVPAEELPEWLMEIDGVEEALAAADVEELPEEEGPEPVEAAPEEELPGWLTEAVEDEEIPEIAEIEPEEVEAEQAPLAEAVPAEELPEWLMEMEGAEEALATSEAEAEAELPDWLAAGAVAASAVAAAEILGEEETPEPAEAEAMLVEETPEPVEAEAAPEEELPGWLTEAVEDEEIPEIAEIEPEEVEAEQAPLAEAVPAEELPEWLMEMEGAEEALAAPEAEAEAELPDWLAAGAVAASAVAAAEILGEEETPEPVEAEAAPEEELPEWLTEAAEDEEIPEIAEIEPEEVEAEQAPLAEAVPAEELPEWLMEMEGAEEALATSEAEAEAELPDWLAAGAVAASAVAAAEILGEEETPEPVEAEAAPEEELPEWLTEAAEDEEIPEIAEIEPGEVEAEQAPLAEAVPAEELPEWLMEMEGAEEALAASEAEAEAELPDWLAAGAVAASAVAAAEILGEEETPEPVEAEAAPEEELPEWLTEAAEDEEIPEIAEIEPGEVEAEQAPLAEAVPAEELPEWLMEMEGAEEALAASEAEAEAELPDWLAAGAVAASAVAAAEILEEDETAEPAEAQAILEEQAPEPLEAETAPEEEWLTKAKIAAQALGTAKTEAEDIPAEGTPEPADAEPEQEAPEPVEFEPEAEAAPTEEIPEWLVAGAVAASAIAAAEILDGDVETPEIAEAEADVAPGEELPDWVLEAAGPGDEVVSPEPVKEAALEEEVTELDIAEVAPDADIPDFLKQQEVIDMPLKASEMAGEDRMELEDEGDIEEIFEAPSDLILGDTQPTRARVPDESLAVETPDEEVEEPHVEEPPAVPIDESPVGEVSEDLEEAPLLDDDDAFAWLESLAVKQGADEALLLSPDERIETPPDWVQAAEEEAVESIEPTIEAPEVEKPETETIVEATVEQAELAQPVDDDDAFAWLESLAVKQGAEEALLLTPEERLETPPEWVEEAKEDTEPEVVEAEEEPQLQDALATISIAQAALDEYAELEEEKISAEIAAVEVVEELPVEEGQEQIVDEAIPEAKEEEPPLQTDEIEEPESVALEPIAEVAEPTESIDDEEEPDESVPELPEWLAEEPVTTETPLEWTPPVVQLELNQASLAELERLPGIGFIMAQNIINYRDQVGGFRTLDDLLQVPEFNPATLEELKERLYVDYTPVPEQTAEAVVAERTLEDVELAPELIEARTAINQGELERAIDQYSRLIQADQLLPEVIEELQVAAYEYPEVVEIWQSLGDAYLRVNRIQDALEAYVKAEELLR